MAFALFFIVFGLAVIAAVGLMYLWGVHCNRDDDETMTRMMVKITIFGDDIGGDDDQCDDGNGQRCIGQCASPGSHFCCG